MATAGSIVGGRRRHRTSLFSSRPNTRKRAADKTKDEALPPSVDIEELRKVRAAFYNRSPEERQKATAKKGSTASQGLKAEMVRPSRTSKLHSHDVAHRAKRKHRSSRHSTEKIRTEDDGYVYATPMVLETVEPIGDKPSLQDSIRDAGEQSSAQRPRHSSSKMHHRHRSSGEKETAVKVTESSRSRPSLGRSSPAKDRSSRLSRPLSRRSSTTSHRLSVLPEQPEPSEKAPSIVPSRRDSRRNSSLLSLFSSKPAAARAPPLPPRLVECLTCASDDVPAKQSAKLACGHRMCHACLRRIFIMSITDPAHMPPRCCTSDHIPLKHVDALFSTRFKEKWNLKYQEWTTKNRVYCPQKGCGEWIKPSHFGTEDGRKYARCAKCKTKVCVLCNGKWHSKRECPKDDETNMLADIAKEKGWQRCHSCKAMVELKEGCNHMTCRCTAEFCMLCGAQWKTCECPWFNYGNPPNPDALDDMRVPEPLQIIYRRAMAHAQGQMLMPPPPPLPAANQAQLAAEGARLPAQRRNAGPRTYTDEVASRRRQERLDADLARRMQLASLMDGDDPEPPGRATADLPGLGNLAGHFMNHDFVQNAADVVMAAFGDAAVGRRGERAAARRRRPRDTGAALDAGIAPDAFGTESVLGVAPTARSTLMPPRPAQASGTGSGEGAQRVPGWLEGMG